MNDNKTDPKVISLQKFRESHTYKGEWQFMVCQCSASDDKCQTGFIPLAIHDAHGAIVGGLLCLKCDEVIPLINGRPQ